MISKKSTKLHFMNLAVKNLLLYKQRTILTFLILSFGIMVYIVMDGMLVGMTNEAIKTLIDLRTGDIQIYGENYDRDEQFTIYPIDSETVEAVIKSDQNIKAHVKRIQFTAMVESTYSMMPITVYGVDYLSDKKVLSTLDYIKSSQSFEFFKTTDTPYAFLGFSLADQLGLKEGDWILLSFRTKDGMYNSLFLEIGGLIHSPELFLNASSIIVPYSEAKAALNIDGPTQYIVKTKNYLEATHYLKSLKQKLPAFTLSYWMEEGKEFIELNKMKQKNSGIFIVFVIVIAVIGIVNTMIMSVFEKIREIGTLKAIGFYNREISFIFSLEGLLLGFFGSLAGVVLGGLINWYFVVYGINIAKLMSQDAMGSLGIIEIMHSSWNIKTYLVSLVAGTLLSYIATLSTAKRAALIEPAKVLRTI